MNCVGLGETLTEMLRANNFTIIPDDTGAWDTRIYALGILVAGLA
jgi:hypothetical protein